VELPIRDPLTLEPRKAPSEVFDENNAR